MSTPIKPCPSPEVAVVSTLTDDEAKKIASDPQGPEMCQAPDGHKAIYKLRKDVAKDDLLGKRVRQDNNKSWLVNSILNIGRDGLLSKAIERVAHLKLEAKTNLDLLNAKKKQLKSVQKGTTVPEIIKDAGEMGVMFGVVTEVVKDLASIAYYKVFHDSALESVVKKNLAQEMHIGKNCWTKSGLTESLRRAGGGALLSMAGALITAGGLTGLGLYINNLAEEEKAGESKEDVAEGGDAEADALLNQVSIASPQEGEQKVCPIEVHADHTVHQTAAFAGKDIFDYGALMACDDDVLLAEEGELLRKNGDEGAKLFKKGEALTALNQNRTDEIKKTDTAISTALVNMQSGESLKGNLKTALGFGIFTHVMGALLYRNVPGFNRIHIIAEAEKKGLERTAEKIAQERLADGKRDGTIGKKEKMFGKCVPEFQPSPVYQQVREEAPEHTTERVRVRGNPLRNMPHQQIPDFHLALERSPLEIPDGVKYLPFLAAGAQALKTGATALLEGVEGAAIIGADAVMAPMALFTIGIQPPKRDPWEGT